MHGAENDIVSTLLLTFPDSVNEKGAADMTPLDCALYANDNARGFYIQLFIEATTSADKKKESVEAPKEKKEALKDKHVKNTKKDIPATVEKVVEDEKPVNTPKASNDKELVDNERDDPVSTPAEESPKEENEVVIHAMSSMTEEFDALAADLSKDDTEKNNNKVVINVVDLSLSQNPTDEYDPVLAARE